VHEVPDQLTNGTAPALVDLGGLDQFLLDLRLVAPQSQITGLGLVVLLQDKASIINTQGSLEHTLSPRPPGGGQLLGQALALTTTVVLLVIEDLDVLHGVDLLLLGRIGNLGNRGHTLTHFPFLRTTNAAEVAVTDLEHDAVTPNLVLLLVHDLEVLVDHDPLTATGTNLGEGLTGHEVVGLFDTHANVGNVLFLVHAEFLPEFGVFGLVFDAVHLLDALGVHVFVTILLLLGGKRTEAVGEEVDNGNLQVGEKILKLGGPLDADETLTLDEDGLFLLVQLLDFLVLLENVSPPTLDEPLVDVGPEREGPLFLVDGGEPQRFTLGVKEVKVATGLDDTVVVLDLLQFLGEHGLDHLDLLLPDQVFHLPPDELAAHLVLDHVLEREGQLVEVLGLDVAPQDTGGVFEELLLVDNGDVEPGRKVLLLDQTTETTTDNKDSSSTVNSLSAHF